jgi:hypothetical protein
MKIFSKALLVFAMFLFCSCVNFNSIKPDVAVRSQEIVAINVRPDVEVKLAIIVPSAQPKGIMLMFPGGDGAGINSFSGKPGGEIGLGDNFVVRTAPAFVRQGYIVAIMDTPSDQSGGMSKKFRESEQHHQDVRKAIEFLKNRYKQKPLYPVAFSMSNVSVVALAAKNYDLPISGVIFISGVWKSLIYTGEINNYSFIGYPVLVVHHKDDMCSSCLVDGANTFFDLLETKGRKNLVVALGGVPYPNANPCGPLHYHGYAGMEDIVIRTIVDWMNGKEVLKEIRS